MSRSSAVRRPSPTTAPRPAGPVRNVDIADFAIARDRRRGRGTLSNASGRFEPIARIAFDDGWQSL
jgi:hypothetical protein